MLHCGMCVSKLLQLQVDIFCYNIPLFSVRMGPVSGTFSPGLSLWIVICEVRVRAGEFPASSGVRPDLLVLCDKI